MGNDRRGILSVVAPPRKRSGYVTAAAGVAWFFPEWNNSGIGSSIGFTFGLLAWALATPLVAHAVLAYPFAGPYGRLIGSSLLGPT